MPTQDAPDSFAPRHIGPSTVERDQMLAAVGAPSLDALIARLPDVVQLDRHAVRRRALERFGVDRMVEAHIALYAQLAAESLGTP